MYSSRRGNSNLVKGMHLDWYKTKLLHSFFALLICLISFPVSSVDYLVNTAGDGPPMPGQVTLRDAILASNASNDPNGDTISFSAVFSISLQSALPLINRTNPLAINTGTGSPSPGTITVDGSAMGGLPLFFVYQGGNVTIQNFNLNNGRSKGGDGGNGAQGGGGGLGAGAAIFVNTGTTVTTIDVNFINNAAQGGDGGGSHAGLGVGGGGGGGMLQGDGGSSRVVLVANSGGGGGGIGNTALGGDRNTPRDNGSGVGLGNGGPGIISTAAQGGNGGNAAPNQAQGGLRAGGGGAGNLVGVNNSGGGGGDIGSPAGNGGVTPANGGPGGFGGGGGGATNGNSNGGNGGFGGGGGGGGPNTVNAAASGYTDIVAGGRGGVANTAGQEGGAAGGAVFVRQGGNYTVQNSNRSTQFSLNTVQTGIGTGGATAVGADLFLGAGVEATFNVGGNLTDTIMGGIGDGGGIIPFNPLNVGNILKLGTGTLIFATTGSNTYYGNTTITSGTLLTTAVDALSQNSAITINPGGTLNLNNLNQNISTPANRGNVTNAGILNVGLATFTTNTYTQTGTFITTLNSVANYGQLVATVFPILPAETIMGTVQLSLVNNGLSINNGDIFNLINNINGNNPPSNAALVYPPSATLNFVRLMNANIYQIQAVRTSFPAAIASSKPCLVNIATALESIRTAGIPASMVNLFTVLAGLSLSDLQFALTQLEPVDINGGTIMASYKIPDLVQRKIRKRFDDARYGYDYTITNAFADPSGYYPVSYKSYGKNTSGYNAGDCGGCGCCEPDCGDCTGDISYGPIIFGDTGKLNNTSCHFGYNYTTLGIGILADTSVYSFARLGAGLTYANTTVNTNTIGNRVTINNYQGYLFGRAEYRWLFLDGLFYFGVNDYQSKRNITFLSEVAGAKYRGIQYGTLWRAGIDIPICTTFLTPQISVQTHHLNEGAYTETGAPDVDLTVAGRRVTIMEGAVGVKFTEASEEDFLPELHFMLIQTLNTPSQDVVAQFIVAGPSFTAPGATFPKFGTNIGLSITARVGENAFLQVGYDYEARNGIQFQEHSAFVKVRWDL